MKELQKAVDTWVRNVLGVSVLNSRRERALRVLEEAIELAQSENIGNHTMYKLVDRVMCRPLGEPGQEAAGVGVTLLAWAAAAGVELEDLIVQEIHRIHQPLVQRKIRAKQAEKAAWGLATLPESGMFPGEIVERKVGVYNGETGSTEWIECEFMWWSDGNPVVRDLDGSNLVCQLGMVRAKQQKGA